MEPHSGSLPDVIRRIWYKHDRFFSDNEASIDVQALEREFAAQFKSRQVELPRQHCFLVRPELLDLPHPGKGQALLLAHADEARISDQQTAR